MAVDISKEALERLERLENHFKVYKNDVLDIKISLNEVRALLGGSELNGKKGFIYLMETIEKKVEILERENENHKSDIEQGKFWGRGLAGVIFVSIGLIIKRIIE